MPCAWSTVQLISFLPNPVLGEGSLFCAHTCMGCGCSSWGLTMGLRTHVSMVPVTEAQLGVWVSVWSAAEVKPAQPTHGWSGLGARVWVRLQGLSGDSRASSGVRTPVYQGWAREVGYGTRDIVSSCVCVCAKLCASSWHGEGPPGPSW